MGAILLASHPLSGGTIIPIVMLIFQTILGMDIVMVMLHTTPPNVDGMEATACSSMKTTQIVMPIIHGGLGMDIVVVGHTIPPNVDLTEAIAWGLMIGITMMIGGMMIIIEMIVKCYIK